MCFIIDFREFSSVHCPRGGMHGRGFILISFKFMHALHITSICFTMNNKSLFICQNSNFADIRECIG